MTVESPIYLVYHTEGGPLRAADVAEKTAKDPVLPAVLRNVMEGWPERSPKELQSYTAKHLQVSA